MIGGPLTAHNWSAYGHISTDMIMWGDFSASHGSVKVIWDELRYSRRMRRLDRSSVLLLLLPESVQLVEARHPVSQTYAVSIVLSVFLSGLTSHYAPPTGATDCEVALLGLLLARCSPLSSLAGRRQGSSRR